MDTNEVLLALVEAFRVVGYPDARAQEMAIVVMLGVARGLITMPSVWRFLFDVIQVRRAR